MCKTATFKKTKNGFQDKLSLNGGQKYCRMLHLEHSAILLTFIKLPFVIKIFVLSIFEWPLNTGFAVHCAFTKVTETTGAKSSNTASVGKTSNGRTQKTELIPTGIVSFFVNCFYQMGSVAGERRQGVMQLKTFITVQ